jgi:chaperonin cofactor prefoldin
MDFLINRIEKIEQSLVEIDKFVEEFENVDSDAAQLSQKYSIENQLNEIKKSLKTIKSRIENDQIIEKSNYSKLKQMKTQYEDLADYLSKKNKIEA